MKKQYIRIPALFVFLAVAVTSVLAQSTDQNYVLTRTFTNDAGTTYLDEIQYFDGLGRAVQKVQKKITPSGNDLVTLQEYNGVDKESYTWMPTTSTGNGAYVAPESFKSSAISFHRDNNPYSLAYYDGSSDNRVIESYGPGASWHSKGKSVKQCYLSNLSTDVRLTCRRLKVTGTSLTSQGYYASGKLYVTEFKDEDDNTSYEFKNSKDQVVLTRQLNKVNGIEERHDTYYVYDDCGNLSFILPPLASDALTDNGIWSEPAALMKDYAYQYRYDEMKRCTQKKLPGCDWIFNIYDKTDQLILTQDGEQRQKNEWKFTIPDALGRVVLTGILKNSTGTITQANFKNKYIRAEFGDRSSAHADYYHNYGIYDWALYMPTFLTVHYYDGYDFKCSPEVKYSMDKADYNTRYDHSSYSAKGLLTGTYTGLSNNSGRLLNACYYYDSRGRAIQINSICDNSIGVEQEVMKYDFKNHLIQKNHNLVLTTETSPFYRTSLTEEYFYTYDHAGRCIKTQHQVNSGNLVTLSEKKYNEKGLLLKETPFGRSASAVSYGYNIRSWINNISSCEFWEELYHIIDPYQKGSYCYNGNVSTIYWHWGVGREFRYKYDNLSRLVNSTYDPYGDNSETFTYDKHGNLRSILRRGSLGIDQGRTIDNLTFTYKGNQPLTATDTGSNLYSSASYDFKDYSKNISNPQYRFNMNGALTQDPYKGMTVTYNSSIGVPTHIDVPAIKGTIDYLYSADGKKLRAEYQYNPQLSLNPLENVGNTSTAVNTSATRYFNNIIYEGKFIDGYNDYKILTENGYYEKTFLDNGIYYFYVKDHQGNIRLVVDQTGNVVQSNHYYPFGMPIGEGYKQEKQPYKYNGKEFDTMHGLNQYDYHARAYDPVIQRFTSVDPLCEKYYSISPYAYCLNNPVRYIDPNGKDGWDIFAGYGIGFVTNIIPGSGGVRDFYSPNDPSDYNNALRGMDNASLVLGSGMIAVGGGGMSLGGTAVAVGVTATAVSGGTLAVGGVPVAAAGGALIQAGAVAATTGAIMMANGKQNQNAGYDRGKKKLSETKNALKRAKEAIGLSPTESLPKSEGKFGSPQRGDAKKGYRLDPPHPNAKKGTPESNSHINYWDYTEGKRGNGGIEGAISITTK